MKKSTNDHDSTVVVNLVFSSVFYRVIHIFTWSLQLTCFFLPRDQPLLVYDLSNSQDIVWIKDGHKIGGHVQWNIVPNPRVRTWKLYLAWTLLWLRTMQAIWTAYQFHFIYWAGSDCEETVWFGHTFWFSQLS